MSHISNQAKSDLTEAISFVSKSGIKQKSIVDEVIADFGGAKISHEEAMEIISNYSESEVGPELYAELHPESVIIKEHNKKLANTCEFKTQNKTCEYKNYWEKCAFCKKELSR